MCACAFHIRCVCLHACTCAYMCVVCSYLPPAPMMCTCAQQAARNACTHARARKLNESTRYSPRKYACTARAERACHFVQHPPNAARTRAHTRMHTMHVRLYRINNCLMTRTCNVLAVLVKGGALVLEHQAGQPSPAPAEGEGQGRKGAGPEPQVGAWQRVGVRACTCASTSDASCSVRSSRRPRALTGRHSCGLPACRAAQSVQSRRAHAAARRMHACTPPTFPFSASCSSLTHQHHIASIPCSPCGWLCPD